MFLGKFLLVASTVFSERACGTAVCKALDGKHFKVEDMEVGVNAPPMHPRCHCTTAPYWDQEAFDRWLDGENQRLKTETTVSSDGVYKKNADPIKEALGPIKASHPEEIERIKRAAEQKGVELVVGKGNMAYAPGLSRGKAGQLHLSEEDSYGAWLHEEQHMIDDEADGWPGFAGLMDIDRRCRMEYNAYKREFDLALSIGRPDLADKLKILYEEEVKRIGGEPIDFD